MSANPSCHDPHDAGLNRAPLAMTLIIHSIPHLTAPPPPPKKKCSTHGSQVVTDGPGTNPLGGACIRWSSGIAIFIAMAILYWISSFFLAFILDVISTPKVLVSPGMQLAESGEDVTFRCLANGPTDNLDNRVTWLDGSRFSPQALPNNDKFQQRGAYQHILVVKNVKSDLCVRCEVLVPSPDSSYQLIVSKPGCVQVKGQSKLITNPCILSFALFKEFSHSSDRMGAVRITSLNSKFNVSHFGLPPSSIHRMTGWVANFPYTMTYATRPPSHRKTLHGSPSPVRFL